MICFPKISSMVPRNCRWYPKWWSKWLLSHFLDPQNDENWSYNKMCQEVWVPLGYHPGYHLGTIRHSGYHWGTILGTMVAFLCAIKIEISSNFEIFVLFWVPNGTQSGTQMHMVPKIFSSKSLGSQLSKTVSTVAVRLLDRFLSLFEISSKMAQKLKT